MQYPFGSRGSFPTFIPIGSDDSHRKELESIPGVRPSWGGLHCTWDAAEVVTKRIGLAPPVPPATLNNSLDSTELTNEILRMPGLDEYRRLKLRENLRQYQREGAVFTARRSFAMNCDQPRLGKTLQALAGSVLIGAKKTLIICPALVAYVWAEEIWKWLGKEAIILEGLRGTVGRRFCGTCGGRGFLPDVKHCPACKYLNGQSRGSSILVANDARRELFEAIHNAEYVIVTYELLQPHRHEDSTGRKSIKAGLAGWKPVLSRFKFDLSIIDEIHQIRGWKSNSDGHTRRESVVSTVDPIEVVWGLTATPVFSYTRDLWAPFDLISKGALTGPGRKPFKFHVYACDGHKGEYGWVADGRSIYAETEIPDRMRWFVIQRDRSQVMSQMPPKTRQVIRIDSDPAALGTLKRLINGKTGKRESKLVAALGQTGAIKRPVVIENVMNEVIQGGKVIVFTHLERSAVAMHREMTAALTSRTWGPPARARNTELWLVTGERVDASSRPNVARAFREHQGAAVMVATIGSMQVGISLKGAQSVHFAELSWDPSALLQAEDRPYEPGTLGVSIVYYVVRGSIDEHVEALVMPKFRTLEKVVKDSGAISTQQAFAGAEESMDELFDRLFGDSDITEITDQEAVDFDDL